MTARQERIEDLVERYLPDAFASRIAPVDRPWRGRIVLLLWASGYPLEMAWSIGMTADADQSAFYFDAAAQLDDAKLVALLDATAVRRGDGSHVMFATFG